MKYDILNFYRDNLIASSGTVGDWVDVGNLPSFLGKDLTERLVKWEAYAKTGKKLYDSSQEGQIVNTAFGGFDDTVKYPAIQAIDLAMQRVEEMCSTITGVFREKLGGIEQRDAVTNVQVGITHSTHITKQYFQNMDLMLREFLLASLDLAKIVFKNGITGSIILGDNLNKIFTALPEHYTHTDFDIHIPDSSNIIKEQETIKQFGMELSKQGAVDPAVLLEVVTSTSLTKMKNEVMNALNKTKEENSTVGQLTQQVEEMNKALSQYTSEIESLQKQLEKVNKDKQLIEEKASQDKKELDWFKAKSDDNYKDENIKLQKKRVELEALQLIDTNPDNNEVKNN